MKKFVKVMSVAIIVVLALALLAACGGSVDSYKAKLEKKGYTVVANDKDGVKGLVASKGDDMVTIAIYDSADAAKKAETEAKIGAAFLKMEVYRTGKVLMMGTAQGINDAK